MTLQIVSDFLVIAGLVALTVGVYGIIVMPDAYLKIHAASKAVLLGSLPILLSAALSGGFAIATKAAMIAVLLILTTPVAAHAITKAVAAKEEREL